MRKRVIGSVGVIGTVLSVMYVMSMGGRTIDGVEGRQVVYALLAGLLLVVALVETLHHPLAQRADPVDEILARGQAVWSMLDDTAARTPGTTRDVATAATPRTLDLNSLLTELRVAAALAQPMMSRTDAGDVLVAQRRSITTLPTE